MTLRSKTFQKRVKNCSTVREVVPPKERCTHVQGGHLRRPSSTYAIVLVEIPSNWTARRSLYWAGRREQRLARLSNANVCRQVFSGFAHAIRRAGTQCGLDVTRKRTTASRAMTRGITLKSFADSLRQLGVATRTSGRGPVLIVSRKASAYVISGLLCSILATAHV